MTQDQLAIIRISGMHCHRCEEAIRKTLTREDGVHEVEVDFLSGQASILFDHAKIDIPKLIEIIHEAGYQTTGYARGGADA